MTDEHDPDDLRPPETALDRDVTVVSSSRTFDSAAKRVATLVVVQGTEIGRRFPLRRNEVILGRGENADILLRSKEISRQHARIRTMRVGDEILYRLTDLESTNHVFVNGERVDVRLLTDGDKIHLGDVVAKFELHDAIDAEFHDEIRSRIEYDDLTGLLTYQSFRTALEWELERNASSPTGCAVVMMDIDDFKRLNDTYGHLAGSFVLEQIGELIRENLRHFDVAARYGGEEFVAYLPETEVGEAHTAADRLRRILAETPFRHRDREIRLTISMGLSHFPEDGTHLESLIQSADERLYRAKADGKNRVYGKGQGE